MSRRRPHTLPSLANRGERSFVAGLLCCVVLLALATLLAPSIAYASESTATVTARVRVFQEYKVDVSGLQNTFEYAIEPVEDDAPLPVDAAGKTFDRFTLTREEGLWLEFPVEVTVDPSATPYVYHYMLVPAQKELPDGLYYVDVLSTSLEAGVNEYPLELHVQPANADAALSVVTPTVHVDGWDGPKVTDPGWRVGYTAPEDEPEDTKPDGGDATGDGASGGSATRPSGTSPQTSTATRRATGSPLATTGDVLAPGFVPVILAIVGAATLACASRLRAKEGDRHA